MRQLQKYAVRIGGGNNHRFGLHDAVLIKDNHIAAWHQAGQRPLADAVRSARNSTPPRTVITIEVESITQLEEVLPGQPDIVLLDNMDTYTLEQAVRRVAGRVLLEASGGVRLDNVEAIARTGVDYISSGALTHSVKASDIALEVRSGCRAYSRKD